MSARNLLARTRQGSPLPEGTLAVGIGLLVTGATAYGFLVAAARALGAEQYAALSVLWALVFLAGPGFFLPLEQEVGRALASRRVRRLGAGPLVGRAALLGSGLVVVLVIAALFAARPIISYLLDGDVLLFAGLLVALVGYFIGHLARGTLSGLGRFRAYSLCLAGEGVVRLVACLILAVGGVTSAGPYGLALGLAPFAGVAIALRGQRDLVSPGPAAPWNELSASLGWLLTGSVLAQLLVNGGPLAVKLLSTEAETAAAGRFLASLIVARVPLFLFVAVQAALLPALAALAGAGHLSDFRRGIRRLMAVVAGLGIAATIGALSVGPWVVRVLFGAELALGRRDLGLLVAATGAYMAAIALAQALIALSSPARMALAWLVGTLSFIVVTALGDDLLLRTELGLLAGCTVAATAMAALLVTPLRGPRTSVPTVPSG
ncbi:MAG: hypothetical protein M3507_07375 [Actinomycetota bacterium]|nr:hypothetical protein [Actinomycetota bacterium]